MILGSGATVASPARGLLIRPFMLLALRTFSSVLVSTTGPSHQSAVIVLSFVNNRFVGDVDVFYQIYQMHTLLYGLVRFYLQKNALGPRSSPKEVFDWNQYVGCGVVVRGRNPTNLVPYAACKLLSLLPSSR